MATALIRMLGLPVQGYTAPQVICHGDEPEGYVLGTKGTESQGQVITFDQNGFETYSSLYTVSTRSKTGARGFQVQCLSDFVPLLGHNTYGHHYYPECNDGHVNVADTYDCNKKINEANIPYISGELVAYGCLSTEVLPLTHVPNTCWTEITCHDGDNEWSRLYTANDAKCLYDNMNTITHNGNTPLVCTYGVGSIYSSSLDTLACQTKFGGRDPQNNGNGYIRMAMFTTDAYSVPQDECASNPSKIHINCPPASTITMLAPNCGEYLATFYKTETTYYVTGIHKYDINTNTLGPNIYMQCIGDWSCNALTEKTLEYDNTHCGTYCTLYKCGAALFIYMEIIPNTGTLPSLTPKCCSTVYCFHGSEFGSAFIHSMQYSEETCGGTTNKYLSFYDIPLKGHIDKQSSVVTDQDTVAISDYAELPEGTCICDHEIYRLRLDGAFVRSCLEDIKQYHWDTCEKVSNTNVQSCMHIQGTDTTTTNNNGGT